MKVKATEKATEKTNNPLADTGTAITPSKD